MNQQSGKGILFHSLFTLCAMLTGSRLYFKRYLKQLSKIHDDINMTMLHPNHDWSKKILVHECCEKLRAHSGQTDNGEKSR